MMLYNYIYKYKMLAHFMSILICVSVLGACSSALNTRITTFKDQKAGAETGTVVILPFDKTTSGSLEFSWFAEPLAIKMEALGFQVVEGANAEYSLELAYGVNRREADNRNNDTLILSGGFGGFRRGTSLGVVIDADNDKRYEYERIVQLRLRKNTAGDTENKSLIEVSALSIGHCDLILPVYPIMLDAIFKDFYRANGSTVHVKGSIDANECKSP